jgi:hypothetical protein
MVFDRFPIGQVREGGGIRHACPMPMDGARMPQEQRRSVPLLWYCQREQSARVATSRGSLVGSSEAQWRSVKWKRQRHHRRAGTGAKQRTGAQRRRNTLCTQCPAGEMMGRRPRGHATHPESATRGNLEPARPPTTPVPTPTPRWRTYPQPCEAPSQKLFVKI